MGLVRTALPRVLRGIQGFRSQQVAHELDNTMNLDFCEAVSRGSCAQIRT